MIDIGGGSTEITLGTAARVQLGRSFKLGVIRLDGALRVDAIRCPAATSAGSCATSSARPRSYLRQIRKRGFERVIGTSGTILSLGALAGGAAAAPRTSATCASAPRRCAGCASG